MMHKPIAHARFVNITRFRVAYSEMFISTMAITPRNEILVECDDIVHQISCEFLYIFAIAFPYHELFPCSEQIFKRDDSVVGTRINTP